MTVYFNQDTKRSATITMCAMSPSRLKRSTHLQSRRTTWHRPGHHFWILALSISIYICIGVWMTSSGLVSAYILHSRALPSRRDPPDLLREALLRSNERTSPRHSSTRLFDSDANHKQEDPPSNNISVLDKVGLVSQPIVWISLYSVATTGGGLPEGPYGLIGAVEGLAYLTVVGWAGVALRNNGRQRLVRSSTGNNNNNTTAIEEVAISEKLSLATIGIGLLVLANLVMDQGCVPNAKPILDYSAYVQICDVPPTLGFLGGVIPDLGTMSSS